MKILITGDSHTGALKRGLLRIERQGLLDPEDEITVVPMGNGKFLATPFFRDAGDHAEITEPDFQRNFRQFPPSGSQADVFGLSMPLWPMRVVRMMVNDKWDLDGRSDGCKPLSRAVFRQMVLADQQYVLALIRLLQRSGRRVLAISPPLLFADNINFEKMPAGYVLNLVDGYRSIMKDELAGLSVPVIDIPKCCIDDTGLMRREYAHEDPEDRTHANGTFGQLMIQSIQRWAANERRRLANSSAA